MFSFGILILCIALITLNKIFTKCFLSALTFITNCHYNNGLNAFLKFLIGFNLFSFFG
jgi:hypothetical protein